ncbi:MAG: Spy/CpxP family protein refolding chaperone [bacterium]
MKKSVFFILVIALVLSLFSFVYAAPLNGTPPMNGQGGMGMHQGEGPGMMGSPELILGLADELKLSSEQLQKIEVIKSKSRRDFIQHRADMELNALDIQDELKKDNSDKAKIYSLIDEMSAITSKMLKTRMTNLLEAKKILSKEQFAKLVLKMENGKKNFMGKTGTSKGNKIKNTQ